MKKARLILFGLLVLVKAVMLFYAGYLNTYLLDFFAWGNSTRDGLYLLVVPVGILPAILVLSVLEWAVIRKIKIPAYVKASLYGSVFIGLIVTFCSIFEMYWTGFVIACLGSVGILIELIIIANPLTRRSL
ncbi:MAG: hypothetical protein OEY56_07715 [Cyclobacteriaceae bacterium]|nr:hypothetical protein [Cyclobacteriaceae bacterium]